MRWHKRVAVVVPAFNEAEHIRRVIREMPPWVDQVIVVDDASGDGTPERLEGLSERVTVLVHSINRGVGAALRTGYERALRDGADVVAVMAGDGQMRGDELGAVVGPVAMGQADYCKGDRTSHPDAHRMPRVRRVGTHVLTRWTRALSGFPHLRDAQCGFTAISAEMLRRLPLGRLTRRYGYPNDLLVMLGSAGARLVQCPVTPVYEGQRSDLKPWRAIWTHSYVLGRAWWYRQRAAQS
jgi:glycosyltransferase involved in cell wall biosynthesis